MKIGDIMTYEIEILEGGEFHTDLTLNQVRQFLKAIEEDTAENIQIINSLEEWQTAQFGSHLVTCTGEGRETISDNSQETNTHLEELASIGFWMAMEQNEKEFQEYLATNPTPFERKMATIEYLNSRIANEQKYCMLLMNMEREEWLQFQTEKGETPTEEESSAENDDEDSTDDFEDDWI